MKGSAFVVGDGAACGEVLHERNVACLYFDQNQRSTVVRDNIGLAAAGPPIRLDNRESNILEVVTGSVFAPSTDPFCGRDENMLTDYRSKGSPSPAKRSYDGAGKTPANVFRCILHGPNWRIAAL